MNNETLQIIVNNRVLKEVDRVKCLESVLTIDGYCTREIKKRISFAKETFNRKILGLRDLDTKKIGAEVFGELLNVMLEENGEDKMVRESN